MNYIQLANKLMEHEPAVSEPFKLGLVAVLQNRVDQSPVTSPYPAGSVENDAFFAGRMRAHNEFRNLLLDTNGDHDKAVARMRTLAEAAERRVA